VIRLTERQARVLVADLAAVRIFGRTRSLGRTAELAGVTVKTVRQARERLRRLGLELRLERGQWGTFGLHDEHMAEGPGWCPTTAGVRWVEIEGLPGWTPARFAPLPPC